MYLYLAFLGTFTKYTFMLFSLPESVCPIQFLENFTLLLSKELKED